MIIASVMIKKELQKMKNKVRGVNEVCVSRYQHAICSMGNIL
jgi:hypothetical protein